MMHCKFPHCRTTGQRTLPRCVQITSSGESASVWEDKDLTFYTSIFNVLALTWTSVVMLAGHIEHSLWWGRAVESSVSSSVCQQVLQPRLPRLWALTTQRKGCSCIEHSVMLKMQSIILATYLLTKSSTFCPRSHCRTVWEQHKLLWLTNNRP